MFGFLKRWIAGPPPLTKRITDERLARWRSYADYVDWCQENNVLPNYARWHDWYNKVINDGPGVA